MHSQSRLVKDAGKSFAQGKTFDKNELSKCRQKVIGHGQMEVLGGERNYGCKLVLASTPTQTAKTFGIINEGSTAKEE